MAVPFTVATTGSLSCAKAGAAAPSSRARLAARMPTRRTRAGRPAEERSVIKLSLGFGRSAVSTDGRRRVLSPINDGFAMAEGAPAHNLTVTWYVQPLYGPKT